MSAVSWTGIHPLPTKFIAPYNVQILEAPWIWESDMGGLIASQVKQYSFFAIIWSENLFP